MRLKNKVALITGAAQGLGAAMAIRFAEEGATVFICDTNAEVGHKTTAEINNGGGKAFFQPLDVTKEDGWIAAMASVVANCGRLDVLVNNAGINIRETVEEMTGEHFDTMLAVNVKGPFMGIKHAIPLMRKGGGGSIINMSSICGLVGHRYTTEAYTVTKGALTLMTKSVGVRYAKDNIRCNSIHPCTVNTPYAQSIMQDPKKREERLGEVPLGRIATELDVANAALYLASDEASFINGVAFPVDGGLTAC
jgi:NAD(P)-dependent dehydrogenase (short-subunit alcohol dehydrogenase family)